MARQENLYEGNRGIFVLLSRDTRFLDYQNAQKLLTAARNGRDVTKRDNIRR
jgi:hypothetical protein